MVQFICKCCGKSFNGISPFKEHLENKCHDKMNQHYICKFCNRRYDEALLFINHCLNKLHHEKVKQKEILNRVNEIQQLRKLNSSTCSSILSTNNINFKCEECNVNISNVWTEADKHFRSEKHIKNLIEKEIYKMLNLTTQNLPSRTAVRKEPINFEKLSEQQQKIKMEVQRENCNSKILRKNKDENCDKSNEKNSIKKNETLLQNQNTKISRLSQYDKTSSCQKVSTKSKLPNFEPSSCNTSSKKGKTYEKQKSSIPNLKINDKTVKKITTVKTIETVKTTTTTTVIRGK